MAEGDWVAPYQRAWDSLIETFDAQFPPDPECPVCHGVGFVPLFGDPCGCRDHQ